MSDEALRRSERRWRGGAEADAEGLARHLVAQVRAGTLPAEAARVAERLAAGGATVEDVLLAGLGGHPWARDVAAEALAEQLAYEGRERALDVALEDGAPTPDAFVDWLDALRALRPAALGAALLAAHERLRSALEALPPPADPYADRANSLDALDRAQEALESWLAHGREAGVPFDDGYFFDSDDDAAVVAAIRAVTAAGEMLDDDPRPRSAMREWVDALRAFVPAQDLRAVLTAELARPMLGPDAGASP